MKLKVIIWCKISQYYKEKNCIFFCHLWNLRKGKRIQKQWGNVLFDIHQTARCWELNLNFGLYLIISILPSHLQQRYHTKASCSRGRTFWEVKMVGWLDGALRVSAYKFSNSKTTLKTRKIKRWGEVSFTHVRLLCGQTSQWRALFSLSWVLLGSRGLYVLRA